MGFAAGHKHLSSALGHVRESAFMRCKRYMLLARSRHTISLIDLVSGLLCLLCHVASPKHVMSSANLLVATSTFLVPDSHTDMQSTLDHTSKSFSHGHEGGSSSSSFVPQAPHNQSMSQNSVQDEEDHLKRQAAIRSG